MAIDKAAIIEAVYQGAGQDAKNLIPPTMWSYNDAIPADTYDPEAAKKMLEEAGVSGLTIDLWAMPVSRPYNPNAQRVAELIQSDWAAVGVTANIAPRLMHELCVAAIAGDRQRAMQIQLKLLPLHKNLFIEANPIPVKWAMARMKLCGPTLRLPMTQLEPANEATVENALRVCGLI